VLLVDHVEPAQGASDTGMDLRMLSYFCGRERSFDELRELAARAGLSVTSVVPAGSRSVVELSVSS
jgi:hypothetical protein